MRTKTATSVHSRADTFNVLYLYVFSCAAETMLKARSDGDGSISVFFHFYNGGAALAFFLCSSWLEMAVVQWP